MSDDSSKPRRRVGVYERPRSADVNWMRWIVMIVALLLAAILLYRMLA